MTLSAYTQNLQYQKTQLQYEAKIVPIADESKHLDEEISKEIDTSMINTPIVYTNESNLSNAEYLQKMILQKILGNFENSNNPVSLFPNKNADISKESHQNQNPYTENANSLPQGFMYSSSYEYYEKTTIEFNAEAIIKTPNAEYKIELNFSYTQEFYEKNETQITMANENFKNPLEIELDEDHSSLKDLKSFHFIFDLFKEEDKKEKDIFEQIKEALQQRREIILDLFKNDLNENTPKQEESPQLDNFKIWQENKNSELSLVAAKKDGVGVFLTNISQDSSYLDFELTSNGYSFSTEYSHREVTISELSSEIKA